jgi:hypothetical protein
MAVTYINQSDMVKGLDSAETGLKIESVRQSVRPQFIEPVLDHQGNRTGAGVGSKQESMAVTGEIVFSTGALTGPCVPDFDTAVTVANSETQFESGGGLYMTDAEITKDRGGWQSVSANYEAYEDQT